MGANLVILERKKRVSKLAFPTCGNISQLKEQFSLFQSVSASFTLDRTAFFKIFEYKEYKNIYDIFSKGDQNLIDSFELFSGLAVIGSDSFRRKLLFLFDLMDFNDVGTITIAEFELLLEYIFQAVFKLIDVEQNILQEEIAKFVNKKFKKIAQINISMIEQLALKNKKIEKFFQLIERAPPECPHLSMNMRAFLDEDKNIQIPDYLRTDDLFLSTNNRQEHKALFRATGDIIFSDANKNSLQFISSVVKKMQLRDQQLFTAYDLKFEMNWVYGFCANNSMKSILFCASRAVDNKKRKALNKFLIYFIRNVVVVYDYKLQKQRHYMRHQGIVTSLAVSQSGQLCASSDYSDRPCIHIWETATQDNQFEISCWERNEIYFMEFINHDQFLVTIGKRHNPPIIIYELLKGGAIYNSYCSSFVLDLSPVYVLKGQLNTKVVGMQAQQCQCTKRVGASFENISVDLQVSFYVISQKKLWLCAYGLQEQQFQQIELRLEDIINTKTQEDCFTALIVLFQNQYIADMFISNTNNTFSLVAYIGLQSGRLLKAVNVNQISNVQTEVLQKFQSPVNKVLLFTDSVFLLLIGETQILSYDFTKNVILMKLQCDELQLKLQNYIIKDFFIGVNNNIFIVTQHSEIVKCKLDKITFWNKQGTSSQLQAKQIEGITAFPKRMNTFCIIEKNSVMLSMKQANEIQNFVYIGCQNGQVLGLSLETHQLVDSWEFDEPITAIDAYVSQTGSTNFAIGTKRGKLVLRIDWENYPKIFYCISQITCVKFSPDCSHLVVGTLDRKLYIFSIISGKIFDTLPKEVSFDKQSPVSINFSQNINQFLVTTNDQKCFEINVEGYKQELLSNNQKMNFSKLKLRYCDGKISRATPIIIDTQCGFCIKGEQEGYVCVFNNYECLENNAGTYFFGHNQRLIDIDICGNKKYMLSISDEEDAIFEWKVNFRVDKMEQTDLNNKKKTSSQLPLQKYSSALKLFPITRPIFICSNQDFKKKQIENSFSYIRGFTNFSLRKVFVEKNTANDKQLSTLQKRFPNFNLSLTYTYGFSAQDLRNCVFYIHLNNTIEKAYNNFVYKRTQKLQLYTKLTKRQKASVRQGSHMSGNASRQLSNKGVIEDKTMRAPLKKHTVISFQQTINDHDSKLFHTSQDSYNLEEFVNNSYEYEEEKIKTNYVFRKNCIEACTRNIIYIASRVVVIIDPKRPNKQRFYENHQNKISAIDVHIKYSLVATSESVSHPQIHVWDPINLTTISIIDTHHRLGVLLLKFSAKKHLVFSVSVDSSVSIQISNWKTECVTAFRNTNTNQIVDIEVNPFNPLLFSTSCLGGVDFWALVDYSIVHLRSIPLHFLSPSEYVTTLNYISYFFNDSDKLDTFITTSNGHLALIGDHYVKQFKQLKKGMVITLSKTILINSHVFIFVAGSDSSLYICDLDFEPIQVIVILERERQKQKDVAIMSMDVFLCGEQINCVCALATGELVELNLSILAQEDKYRFKVSKKVLHEAHSSQNYQLCQNNYNYIYHQKINIAIHPIQNVMASIGDDQMLYVWDLEQNANIYQRNLSKLNDNWEQPQSPTCVKFSTNGDNLIIGFDDGSIMVFRLQLTKINFGQEYIFKADINSDPFVIKDEKINTAVLNLEFSPKGNFMAVSHDNKKTKIRDKQDIKEKSGALIVIYEIRYHEAVNSSNQDNAYRKRRELRLASMNAPEISKMQIFGNACYFMLFSEDEYYLMVYYQNVNDDLIRENKDKEGRYMIWNHESAATEMNWEVLKNVIFRKNQFPNHIFGLRQILGENVGLMDTIFTKYKMETENFKEISLLNFSAVRDGNGGIVFMGSEDGNLFISKNFIYALNVDQEPQQLQKKELCQASRYPAHTSFINQIELNTKETFLLTTGLSDEVIFQWSVTKSEQNQELDHKELSLSLEDEHYQEVPPKDKFRFMIQEVYQQRQQLFDSFLQIDRNVFPAYRLELYRIIGRSAFNRRNNIFVSCNNQLIYAAGTQIVVKQLVEESLNGPNNLLQQSIISDSNTNSMAAKNDITPANLYRESLPAEMSSHTKQLSRSKTQQLEKPVKEKNSIQFIDSLTPNTKSDQKQKSKKMVTIVEDSRTDFGGGSAELLNISSFIGHEKEEINRNTMDQEFISTGNLSEMQIPQQITQLTLAPNKQTLCIGTSELQAQLIFYNITSMTKISAIGLQNCVQTLILQFSDNNRNLACVGLTQDMSTIIFLTDFRTQQILSTIELSYSIPFKIKDLSFVPSLNFEFITIGIVHATQWTSRAGIFTFREFKIEEPYQKIESEFEENAPKHIKNQIFAPSFLIIKFISNDVFLTACMKGVVYVWIQEEITMKTQVYSKSPITQMEIINDRAGEFVVGGFGQPLIYYQLSKITGRTYKLTPIVSIEVFKESGISTKSPQFQIQSLIYFQHKYLLYGTRNGSIKQLTLNFDQIDTIQKDYQNVILKTPQFIHEPPTQSKNKLLDLTFQSDETSQIADFSEDGKYLFILTLNGNFFVYHIKSLTLIHKTNYQRHSNNILIKKDIIFLVFEYTIKALNLQSPQLFMTNHNLTQKKNAPINKARLSYLKDMLSLAMLGQSDCPPYIELFKITGDNKLIKMFTIQTENIKLLDFSVNNQLLMYQEVSGKNFVLNVYSDKLEVKMLDNNDPVEWMYDGFHLTEKRKHMFTQYADEQQIHNIIKIGPEALAVTDTIGSVALQDSHF